MIALIIALAALIASLAVLFALIRKANIRIRALEDREQLREQFYKVDRKGNLEVFGDVVVHGGDRNTYNNAL